jgi:hypothetical protein
MMLQRLGFEVIGCGAYDSGTMGAQKKKNLP